MKQDQNLWPTVPLGLLAHEVRTKAKGQEHLPVLSMSKYRGFVPSLDYFSKQIFSRQVENYKVVQCGQFAYATIHLDEGSIGVLEEFEAGLISPMYTVFEIDLRRVNPHYLLALLKQPAMIQKFSALGQGTVNRRKSVGFKQLAQIQIPLPDLNTQQQIALILSDLHGSQNATADVAEQLQALKRGAMHDLLTKGIPGRHTTFLDTELGMLPEGWEVRPLRRVGAWGGGGTPSKAKPEYWSADGLPWVSPKDMRGTEVSDAEDHITLQAVRESSTNVYPAGTILLVARSGILRNTLPIAITRREVAINQDLKAIVPLEDTSGEFLFQLLSYHAPSILKKCVKAGTTVESLQTAVLHTYQVAFPPIDEQREIVEILAAFDERIRVEQERAKQLEQVKAALAQQLLTGKLTIPEPREVAS